MLGLFRIVPLLSRWSTLWGLHKILICIHELVAPVHKQFEGIGGKNWWLNG